MSLCKFEDLSELIQADPADLKTIEKTYVESMKHCTNIFDQGYPKTPHKEADNNLVSLLKRLGFNRVVSEYNKVYKNFCSATHNYSGEEEDPEAYSGRYEIMERPLVNDDLDLLRSWEKEAEEDLQGCQKKNSSDFVVGHINADSILCYLLVNLGFGEVIREYDKVIKGYGEYKRNTDSLKESSTDEYNNERKEDDETVYKTVGRIFRKSAMDEEGYPGVVDITVKIVRTDMYDFSTSRIEHMSSDLAKLKEELNCLLTDELKRQFCTSLYTELSRDGRIMVNKELFQDSTNFFGTDQQSNIVNDTRIDNDTQQYDNPKISTYKSDNRSDKEENDNIDEIKSFDKADKMIRDSGVDIPEENKETLCSVLTNAVNSNISLKKYMCDIADRTLKPFFKIVDELSISTEDKNDLKNQVYEEFTQLSEYGENEGDLESIQLINEVLEDNHVMRLAGNHLCQAAIRVVTDYDGIHRLMKASSEWFKVLAEESGRRDDDDDDSEKKESFEN